MLIGQFAYSDIALSVIFLLKTGEIKSLLILIASSGASFYRTEYIFPIGRFEERTELVGEKNNPKDFPFPSEARIRKVLRVIFLSSR